MNGEKDEQVVSTDSQASERLSSTFGQENVIDERMPRILADWIDYDRCFLLSALKKVLAVSNIDRDNQRYYGFEQIIKISLGEFLSRKQSKLEITEVRIDQSMNMEHIDQIQAETKKRPDIAFKMNNQNIIIELKTTHRGDKKYAFRDLKKNYGDIPMFLIVVSYPGMDWPYKWPDDEDDHDQVLGNIICKGYLPLNFEYAVYRKTQ